MEVIDNDHNLPIKLLDSIESISEFKPGCFKIIIRNYFVLHSQCGYHVVFDCLYKGTDAKSQKVKFNISEEVLEGFCDELKNSIIETSGGYKNEVSSVIQLSTDQFIIKADKINWNPRFFIHR